MDKQISNILFNIFTGRQSITISRLNQTIEEHIDDMEPDDKYILTFKIEILDESQKSNISEIGFIEGHILEAECLLGDDTSGFLELCDMISGDLLGAAEVFTDRNGIVKPSICPPDQRIMYIDGVYIEENYRNMGMGKYIFDNITALLRYLLNIEPYVCVLLPYPQLKLMDGELIPATEAKEVNETHSRLIRFYKRIGFTEIKNTQYMYKKLKNREHSGSK